MDVVPRLNIFGDHRLAGLCEQVKRDTDALMEQFGGYFTPPVQEVA